eukprot:TRINITY_DN6180_c0_g2_i1.p1 TRINITY_DN6180_c0_g2~~TRINITY_DN6180_c0_g2_i1.p1  ORF type:complete len:127 (-),score=22.68 TRINITY_DN6180_c0_g2_i1:344-676(-)
MILLPLVLFVVVVSATSDCLELGFSNPSCSICTDLQKYIPGTTEIYQKCKECCIPEPGSNVIEGNELEYEFPSKKKKLVMATRFVGNFGTNNRRTTRAIFEGNSYRLVVI